MKVILFRVTATLLVFITALIIGVHDGAIKQRETPVNASCCCHSVEKNKRTELEATGAMAAMKWYNDQRAYPSGIIPLGWREKALTHAEKYNFSKNTETTSLAWTSVGPNNIGGRVRSIAIDPNNTNIIYAGSVSGGIWKSTDAGSSWSPITDFVANIVIGCITIDPTNSSIIYAGTGEGYFNYDAFRGIGVLKSTDAGGTWTVLNNFVNPGPNYYYYFINKIVIRSDNPSILYASVSNQSEGIWKSTNAGSSWSKVNTPTASKFCTDLVIDPTAPNTMYGAFGLFNTDGVYRTTDGGVNWTKLSAGFPATTAKYGRISLAISNSTPPVIFACIADSNYYTQNILKRNPNSASWTAVATPYDNSSAVGGTHLGGQGWYNNVIVVHPTDTNIVYTGGINLFKSTNSGTSWTKISDGYGSPYVHVDQHAIAFDPTVPATMYFGCDGGIFKSINGGNSFTDMNTGFRTVQFYSGAVHPTQNIYYGGTQDNGTLKTTTLPNWTMAFGGDGGATWVDYITPTTVFTEYVNLCIQKSTTSGSTWSKSMNGIPTGPNQYDGTTDRCAFIAPYVMDPSNPLNLVAGTYKIYRTSNGGSSWTGISTDLTGDGTGSSGGTISAIAVAKSSSATIYAGTSGSGTNAARVWVTTNTGSAWSNVTSILPNRYIKAIAVDYLNRDSAYVCNSGYGTGHVYFTSNRGASWVNKSGDLPDIPVNAIIINPANRNHLVVGTDLGVFESTNSGTNWIQQNTGMANVSISDLDINNNGYIFAASHGRGMFKSTTAVDVREVAVPAIPSGFVLNQNYPNPFNPTTIISFSIPERSFVELSVYDMSGREVTKLRREELDAGSYNSDFDGKEIASGVYFYRLSVRNSISKNSYEIKKMILMK